MEHKDTLSIGDLVRETGLSEHTIRAWEQRYRYPQPIRRESGHRRYSDETADHLSQVAMAVRLGLRPSKAVRLTADELSDFLKSHRSGQSNEKTISKCLQHIEAYNWKSLLKILTSELSRSTIHNFCDHLLGPLTVGVGEAWKKGALDIRHEHAFSNNIIHFLDQLNAQVKPTRKHAPLIFCTLPQEDHELGLKMAETCLVSQGHKSVYLGTNTPPPQIIAAQQETQSPCLLMSFSLHNTGTTMTQDIKELRKALPETCSLIIGGSGCDALGRLPKQVETVKNFNSLKKIDFS